MAITIDMGSTYGLYSYDKLRKAIENMRVLNLSDKQIQDILDGAHLKDEKAVIALHWYAETNFSKEFLKRLKEGKNDE